VYNQLLLQVSSLSLSYKLFTAYAQWSTNLAENNAICIDTNQQNACRIVSDGSGGAIITWWRMVMEGPL
jgi:hypothetical protein